jgi:hypothetical protein
MQINQYVFYGQLRSCIIAFSIVYIINVLLDCVVVSYINSIFMMKSGGILQTLADQIGYHVRGYFKVPH